MKILDDLKNKFFPQKKQEPDQYTEKDVVNYYVRDLIDSVWDGNKFSGGFGVTKDYTYIDYYTLRKRSVMLFQENVYARGIIRRLITNLVHKGINLEANPISKMIGLTDEQSIEWAENTELLWDLWQRDPFVCDYNQQKNLGQIQAEIKQTALISGDCLAVMRINRITNLPCVEIIDGCHVQTPLTYTPREGNHIKYGIEFDSQKRQVAYHVYVKAENGTNFEYKRIPAYGEKSGRKIAWMIYGSDKLLDECRGQPMLALILQSLKELDRYKDASARAAVVNSLYPFLIKKTEKSVTSMPFGAVRRSDNVEVQDETGISNQTLKFGYDNPGTIPSLPFGSDVAPLNVQKSDINFGKFEEIIINTVAWMNEIPPEILRLLFQNNYSASRQANNELQLLIDKHAWIMGSDFLQNLYEEWIISCVLIGKIKAPGLLEAWMSNDWQIYNSWLNADWSGLSRPSVDSLKDANTSRELLALGITTFDIEARRNTGLKWRTLVQKLAREKNYMKKVGVTSSVDEDNNGLPVTENKSIENLLMNISDRLDNLEGK